MIPIRHGCAPRRRPSLERRVERLAAAFRTERPELMADQASPCQATTVGRGATLHLDDQSGIDVTGLSYDWSYLQDRARARAGDGDVVVASHPPPAGYEAYCREYLGLGRVTWLATRQTRARTRLASHCWVDREVRRELVRLLRADALRYLHPLMGSREVWSLAEMLHRVSRRPLEVLAPGPTLTAWVNDKVEFAEVVRRLFGDRWLPATTSCASLTAVSREVRELAEQHRVVGVKLPDAAGSGGNVVIPAMRVRGRSLTEVRTELRRILQAIGWRGQRHLLVGAWESDVLSAPSAQLWIPLAPELPVVEGVFEQILERAEGEFVGCRTAELPTDLTDEIVDRAWLLGRFLQRLGYVGRCSFDLVVVGRALDRSRLEFIECNGRWGGTSLPMTLVNRLLPAAAPRAFVVRSLDLPDAGRFRFSDVVERLGDLLFDVRTERGRVVIFNALKVPLRRGVKLVVLGRTTHEAQELLQREIPDRLGL